MLSVKHVYVRVVKDVSSQEGCLLVSKGYKKNECTASVR